MIKSVTVTNYLGESIALELGFPEKSGFSVQGIEGIGPGKASINMTEVLTNDGALYNSARMGSRNIILTLGFLFNPTIEHMRQLSYKYFPLKKRVRLLFETDNRTCEIYGNVESNEPNIFSDQESTQISILCPDPYFYSTVGDVTVFSGIEPMFEFPFENNSLTEDLIEFGNIQNQTTRTIFYSGDAEIGMVMTIHALGDVTNVTIYNANTHGTMKIDTDRLTTLTGFGIIARDDIIISTVKGDKYMLLLRDGTYTNILNCLDKGAEWFQLTKGDNVFAYTADSGVDNLQFRVENKVVYEGV